MTELIEAYQQIHPNISVNYRKVRYEEYERLLLDAWAEGRGPDIFSINNTWVPKYQSKIAPMPASIEMPYVSYQAPIPGCEKKTEEVIELKNIPTLRLSDIEKNYTKTVYQDIILAGDGGYQIYALPLSLDTLALFYNVDLLDKNNIPFPPSDWEEFIEDVRILTRVDIDQNIIQAGAALGTYSNIERAIDIISLLMLQNGADINALSSSESLEAIRFYLDFANSKKETYTWNNNMLNSIDAFVEGKLAFFFGYSYHIPAIKSKAPNLNFAISTVPQINVSSPVNYANYWVESVYKGSSYSKEAWDFILFLNKEQNLKMYLDKTKRPTALRSLIKYQEKDPEIAPFVSQVLTANNWHGFKNFNYIEQGFEEMFNFLYEQNNNFVVDENIINALRVAGNKIQRAKE
jgi:multiple sugar transport system substrate-binding protein